MISKAKYCNVENGSWPGSSKLDSENIDRTKNQLGDKEEYHNNSGATFSSQDWHHNTLQTGVVCAIAVVLIQDSYTTTKTVGAVWKESNFAFLTVYLLMVSLMVSLYCSKYYLWSKDWTCWLVITNSNQLICPSYYWSKLFRYILPCSNHDNNNIHHSMVTTTTHNITTAD